MTVLRHVVVPIADRTDGMETARALRSHRGELHRVTLVHVVQTRPGGIDKAPMDKRRSDARAFLSAVKSRLDDRSPEPADEHVIVDTRIAFGSDVAETIVETARVVDATAIAFRSRGGGRIARLLSGNTATRLVSDPAVPVLSLAAGERPTTEARRRTDTPALGGRR